MGKFSGFPSELHIPDAEREHRIICLSLGGCGDCINSHKIWSDDPILYQLPDYGICTSDYVITTPRLPFHFAEIYVENLADMMMIEIWLCADCLGYSARAHAKMADELADMR